MFPHLIFMILLYEEMDQLSREIVWGRKIIVANKSKACYLTFEVIKMKEVTVTVSSKGQFAIPKAIRTQLGIHAGTQLLMYVKDGDILEMHPFKRSIEMFFGKGKHKNVSMTVREMDQAIEEAVAENDRY